MKNFKQFGKFIGGLNIFNCLDKYITSVIWALFNSNQSIKISKNLFHYGLKIHVG